MPDIASLIDHVRDHADLGHNSATPLYLRVKHGIEEAIQTGLVTVNDALPAERELAGALGVSRVTVRNAVRALVDKGILVQRHGAGTFVASLGEKPVRQLKGFTEEMKLKGRLTTTHWLDRSIGYPTPRECKALEIMPETQVSRLYRLRMVDDKPMCIEHAVLPKAILPAPQAFDGSLYQWLEDHDRRPTRAVQTLTARLLEISQAHLLDAATGSPCLFIERRSFLPLDKVRAATGPCAVDVRGTRTLHLQTGQSSMCARIIAGTCSSM